MTEPDSFSPDYLLIGHITRDLTSTGAVLGGTVSYSAHTAAAFGLRVGIITSLQPGEDLLKDLPDSAQVILKPAAYTTTFRNTYQNGVRTQYMYHRAETLTPDDVPPTWVNAPLVHLGPVAYETAPELIEAFPNSRICMTPQGWMRQREPDGLVRAVNWDAAEAVLPRIALTVLSEEDIRHDPGLEQVFAALAPLLVLTRAERGCTIYENGHPRHVPTAPVQPIDPTGAGDIFATTLLIAWERTGNINQAVQVAHRIAGHSLERRGFAGAPTSSEIAAAFESI